MKSLFKCFAIAKSVSNPAVFNPAAFARALFAAAMAAFLFAATSQSALAQDTASDAGLIGTWTLVRVDNLMPDGSRVHLYGPNPQGMLVFDTHGRYTLQIMQGDRVKFASDDRAKATPEEFKAAAMGSNAHFGRYVVDPAKHTVTFHIDHASFPNWEGTEQTRQLHIDHEYLTYIVPTPTSGTGAIGEVEWKRLN